MCVCVRARARGGLLEYKGFLLIQDGLKRDKKQEIRVRPNNSKKRLYIKYHKHSVDFARLNFIPRAAVSGK
jgi:hypothetical protein